MSFTGKIFDKALEMVSYSIFDSAKTDKQVIKESTTGKKAFNLCLRPVISHIANLAGQRYLTPPVFDFANSFFRVPSIARIGTEQIIYYSIVEPNYKKSQLERSKPSQEICKITSRNNFFQVCDDKGCRALVDEKLIDISYEEQRTVKKME